MLYDEPSRPAAYFKCGELEESYPEAHAAFLADFLCSIAMVDFCVDADVRLWALLGDRERYVWVAGGWEDRSPF
jgi:hypothetical protein